MASQKTILSQELIVHLNKAINAVRQAPDPVPLALVEQLRGFIDFDNYAFVGLDIEGMQYGRGAILMTDMPEAYITAYVEEELSTADPLVQLASPSQPVIYTDQQIVSGSGYPNSSRLVQVIKRFDILPRTGFTLWNSRGAYGGAVFTRKTPFTEVEIQLFSSFVPVLHREAARPALQALSRCIGLSRSELECIRLAAQGLTSDDIAGETPLTRETVNTYLKSATKKLKARNRTQAVVHALRIGMID
jgi:DNA-binding CsgD family transcriptional regulator